jgi:hypothetical protein
MTDEDSYVITDGNTYLYKDKVGRWSKTNDKIKADKFSYDGGQNIINNSISPRDRTNLKLEKYIVMKVIEIKAQDTPDTESETVFDNGDYDWILMCKEFEIFYTNLIKYKNKLPQLLDRVEKEKCDLEHYIEFTDKFGGSEGYKMAKQYHDCRVHRRQLKNDSIMVNIFLESKIEDFVNGRVMSRVM